LYRLMIKIVTWLAGAGIVAYLVAVVAARSDGPGGVQIPWEYQLLTVATLVFLATVAACAHIVEVARQRQQAALREELTCYRSAVKADLGEFLRDEITVWITRSDAHGRGRLVDELADILGARIDTAVRAASSQGYKAGVNQGFAKGVATVAAIPRQDIPHVLGSNVLHLTPHTEE
jgi:hypothetical protein